MRSFRVIAILACVTLAACGEGPGAAGMGRGDLTVSNGVSCPIDVKTSVGYGFCLQSGTAFAVSGQGDCGDVTLWLEPNALGHAGSFVLNQDSTNPAPGQGSAWVTVGTSEFRSTTGSALLTRSGMNTVEVSFEAQLEAFIGGAPGPMASGTVLCDLSD